jgi:hypothetical protein
LVTRAWYARVVEVATSKGRRMRAKNCVRLVVVGAVVMGACRGDGPMAPRTLYLVPDCSQGCLWGDWIGASSAWLKSLSGTAGATLTLDVRVTDSTFRAVPGIAMRWTALHGGGTIDAETVRSDSAGVLRVHWTLDTLVRSDSLVAWFPNGDSVLVIAAVGHAIAQKFAKIAGDSQTVAMGVTPAPFVIRLTDRYGNPVGSTRVAWTVGGLGAVSTLTTTTDASGSTSNTLRAPDQAGVYAIIATVAGVGAVVFRVDVR